MRMPYNQFSLVLDQLYILPLSAGETIHDRCFAIENCLKSNGWSWDEIINVLSEEKILPEMN